MGKNFMSLRARTRRGAVAFASLFGVALGVLTFSSIMLGEKLVGIPIDLVLCISAAVAAAILGGGLFLLLAVPSDKRLARQIDERLEFNERVETMVEFAGKDGAMLEMQRADTERRLGEIPRKRFSSGRVWLNLIAPVLAVGMLIAALAVPDRTNDVTPEPPPVTDPDFNITAIQIQELLDLIKYVKGSNMEREPKAEIVLMLEGLLDDLKAATKESRMKEKVRGVISAVQLLLDEVNSSDDISSELSKSARAELVQMAYMIRELNQAGIGSTLTAVKLSMPDSITKDELKLLCNTYGREIDSALLASEIAESDTLYVPLSMLAAGLSDIAARVADTTMADIQLEFKPLFDNIEIDMKTALNIQSNNKDIADTVIKTLAEIFGLSQNEIPKYEDEDSSVFNDNEQPDDEAPGQGDDGGSGGGDMLYGSDDKVYDPVSGQFVSYGTLINAYQALALSQIKDGKVPVTLEEFINDYFATLFAGFGDDK